jgi:hypothetical protein
MRGVLKDEHPPEVFDDKQERQIRLYYMTVTEVASSLRCCDDTVRKIFDGKMIWLDGRWMISPTDVRSWREANDE